MFYGLLFVVVCEMNSVLTTFRHTDKPPWSKETEEQPQGSPLLYVFDNNIWFLSVS